MSLQARAFALEQPMSPDWNAIRLDLLALDEPMRMTLLEMRPFFAVALPRILARFYEKVRHYDPSCGILKDDAMQEAIRLQMHHWDLIALGDFGPAYTSSIARFCELNQRARVTPQWYIGCRLMFVAEQLMKAVEAGVQIPRYGRAAQEARAKKASMLNAIAKANMLDTENVVAFYFGANRQARKDAIAEASGRFRAIITSLMTASGDLESTARSLSDNAGNTTRLATVVANASADASNNVQSVASATEELASSVREISAQVQESNRIAQSAVRQADETDRRINALSLAANRIGDVIKLITSVAEQTNLLALNATIEAARAGEARILHHAVVDLAEAQRDDVERVVLVQPPRPLRALLRHFRDRALHIAGGEIQRRQFGDRRIDIVRHALLVAVPVHVIDQPADIFAGEVAFQRPGRVGVAERGRHVRHVGIHHALVVQRPGEIDRAAVDADLEAAEHLQIEPGRGDDDVGFEARCRPSAGCRFW
jgi:ABC-type transporter Mla subunit MlaD